MLRVPNAIIRSKGNVGIELGQGHVVKNSACSTDAGEICRLVNLLRISTPLFEPSRCCTPELTDVMIIATSWRGSRSNERLSLSCPPL